MANLEKNFEEALKKANKQIKQHLDKASAELQEAVKISKQYGIPFHSDVSFISQSFKPKSFEEKWNKLDEKYLENVMEDGMYEIPEHEGWEHSAVCWG